MSTALARRFRVDVSIDGGTTWLPLRGINDLSPKPSTPTLQDANDYDTDGWSQQEKTMQAWSLVAKVNRKTSAGVFDPGQEAVRSRQLLWGDDARIDTRWYDRNGAPEAYQGTALVGWEQSKTGVADLEEATITLTGDGALQEIDNPYSSDAVPVITSALDSAVTQGGMVEITGSGFADASGVKFGSTAATSFKIISPNVIVAVMPAGSAGAANVTVTNGAGTSAAFSYTRGA
jgi:hypothetical protein